VYHFGGREMQSHASCVQWNPWPINGLEDRRLYLAIRERLAEEASCSGGLPGRRTISECIALLPEDSTATIDPDFYKDEDVANAIARP
jgi:hypothetical protein